MKIFFNHLNTQPKRLLLNREFILIIEELNIYLLFFALFIPKVHYLYINHHQELIDFIRFIIKIQGKCFATFLK